VTAEPDVRAGRAGAAASSSELRFRTLFERAGGAWPRSFTTGYARSALDETVIDAAIELLPKPFAFHELSLRLRQMLR
jgi:hypothetical protein